MPALQHRATHPQEIPTGEIHTHTRTHTQLDLANLYGSCRCHTGHGAVWRLGVGGWGGTGGAAGGTCVLPLTRGTQVSPSSSVCLPALVSQDC